MTLNRDDKKLLKHVEDKQLELEALLEYFGTVDAHFMDNPTYQLDGTSQKIMGVVTRLLNCAVIALKDWIKYVYRMDSRPVQLELPGVKKSDEEV